MCNSSFQSNNYIFEALNWYCICAGHFAFLLSSITSLMCFVVGMPVHCLYLWVSLHKNIKPNLVFPLNITIADLLFCIQCIIDFIITMYPSLMGYQLNLFVIGLSWTYRPLIQICMCLEHYMAVLYPVTFLRYKGMWYRIALAVAAWIIAVGNSFRLVFYGTEFFPDHIFFLCFCIALTITSFCSASVLCTLKRPVPGDQKNVEMTEKNRNKKTDRGRAVENKQKDKAFRNISQIFVSILIFYFPQVIAYAMHTGRVDKQRYNCEDFPLIVSVTVIVVFISPLVRMYTEGHLKQIMEILREKIKGK